MFNINYEAMHMKTESFNYKIKGSRTKVFIIMVFLFLRDPCLKYGTLSSVSEYQIKSIQYSSHIANSFTFYHKIVYRPLGKKSTSNFLARYLYGNKSNGITNFHLNIRSLKNKVSEIEHIINLYQPNFLDYQK